MWISYVKQRYIYCGGVHNSLGNNNLIKKQKAKVFRYNAGIEGAVEGNTVQLPFVAEYKGDRQTLMEYIWYTKENNQLIKRGIEVSGHGEFGVPTLREYDVLVSLQRLFLNEKTDHGRCELRTEDVTDEYLTINFTIYQLAKEMGYKSPNSLVLNNLRRSIKILLATTVTGKYSGGIYDIKKKKYVEDEISFHLLESAHSRIEYEETENNELIEVNNKLRIKLSRFTYNQMINDYKLFYNKGLYLKTKNLMARKLYHLALQWKGSNNFAWANINTLMEKIPMIEKQEKYRKRYIKKALKILNDKKILKIKYDDQNKDLVYFIFNDSEETGFLLTKYNKFSEIRDAFYNLGFTLDEVDEYLDIQEIRYIQALLRYMDLQLKRDNIEKPKEYFKKCLEQRIKLDGRFFNQIGD